MEIIWKYFDDWYALSYAGLTKKATVANAFEAGWKSAQLHYNYKLGDVNKPIDPAHAMQEFSEESEKVASGIIEDRLKGGEY